MPVLNRISKILGSSSRHDAVSSPGYDALNMSSELLDRIKPLAEKAASSFTPDFIDGPQVGGVEPPEGDRALARGRWAMARRSPAPKDNGRTGAMNPGNPTMEEIQVELGGVDGWFTMFGLHYCTMLANPRMSVLFDTRQDHTRASALDHGNTPVSLQSDFPITLCPNYNSVRCTSKLDNPVKNLWTSNKTLHIKLW